MNGRKCKLQMVLAGSLLVVGLAGGCSWDVTESRLKASAPRFEETTAGEEAGSVETKKSTEVVGAMDKAAPELPAEKPAVEEAPVVGVSPAKIASFTLTHKSGSAILDGTYEVSWQVEGAVSAYVFGDMFNRKESDVTHLATPGQYVMNCGLSEGRFLATYGDGSEIPDNVYAKGYEANRPFLEGAVCDNENEGIAEDDCVGASPHQMDCRIDLVTPKITLSSGSFTSRNHTGSKPRICLVAVGADGVAQIECRGPSK